jgi:hypothetical protein
MALQVHFFPQRHLLLKASASTLAMLAALASPDFALAACTPTGTNQTCTNSAVISGAGFAVYDDQTLNLTNQAAGQLISTGNNSVYSFAGVVIVNDGLIQTTASGMAAVVSAHAGVMDITNNSTGTISGDGAIYTLSTSIDLKNSGLILGGPNAAVDAGLVGFYTKIVNYALGTIRSTGNSAIASNNGLDLTNSGLIETTRVGGGSNAIDVTGGTIVNNAGGQIKSTSGHGIYLSSGFGNLGVTNSGLIASTGTFGAGISDTGFIGITNNVGGTISGVVAGINVLSSGALTLHNAGTISASSGYGVSSDALDSVITNTGTISGSNRGISIGGNGSDITNSGVISGGQASIYYYAGSTGNLLTINPGAMFTGAINWNNNSSNTITFGAGSYTIPVAKYVLASNTINLNNPSQVLVTSGLDINGTGNIVVTAPAAATLTGNLPGTVVTAITSSINDVLDIDIDRPGVIPSRANAWEPLAYGETTASKAARTTGAVLINEDTALDSLGNLVWVRAGGMISDRGTTVSRVGDFSRSGTLTVGLDHTIADWRLGLFLGGGVASASMDDGSGKTLADLGYGGVYARHSVGALTFDATLMGGGLRAETDRYISGSSGQEDANGADHGWFLAPQVAVSTRFTLDPQWSLTPKASVGFTHVALGGYSESGSSQDVTYAAHNLNSFEEKVELKLMRQTLSSDGRVTKLSLSGAVFDRQVVGHTGFSADIGGSGFTVDPNLPKSVLGATVALGAETQMTHAASVYANVAGSQTNDHTRSLAVKGGVKIAF